MRSIPRLFRFRLRTAFLMLTVLGIALGFVSAQRKWIRDRHAALEWVATHHGGYIWMTSGVPSPLGAEHWKADKNVLYTAYDIPGWVRTVSAAPWSLRMFGEQGINNIEFQPTSKHEIPSAEKVAELKRLFPEASVSVAEVDANKVFEFFIKFAR